MSEADSETVGKEGSGSEHPHARSWFGSAPEDADDELVGRVLSGTYRVTTVLGEGGMGRVYAAEHTRLTGKRFAIKVLHHDLVRQPQLQARFEREAEATSLLHHRNIVGVYDVDRTEDGRPFMVCEFLDGRELGDYLDEVGKLTLDVALSIGRQLCRALSVAHEAGVTHRDMKPENVFLVGEDRRHPSVKLLDFGLARLEGPDADSLTQAGTIMGTPSYMAPEQAKGSRVDGRADVYAVGAILYRALTGQRPYEREDARATLAAVLVEEPPRPRAIDPKIPEDVEVVIQTAMARDPAERYQTASDLEDALSQLAGRAPLAMHTAPPPPRSEQASARMVVPPYSRMTLMVMFVLAALWAMSLLVSASVSVLELASGRAAGEQLGVSELALVVGCAIVVLAWPLGLAMRHLRAHYWNNALKVSRAVQSIRLVALTSMASYGVAALTVRMTDSVLSRFVSLPSWPSSAAAWSGWPLALFAVAVLAAGASALSLRLTAAEPSSRGRRILAGPVLAMATTAMGGGIMYASFVLRASAATDVPAPAVVSSSSAATSASAAPTVSASASASASATASASAVERASASELTAAMAGGAPQLEALAKRYPGDSAALRALVELYAKDEDTHLLALDRASRLLEQQPDLASWSTLRVLALKAAQAPEPTSSRAFELMATRMGSDGAILLYDLMVAGNQSARQRAEALLAHEDVQRVASPEVKIAYELKQADSCDAQLALLDRAMKEGDGRAIAVLSYSVDGARKGCGPRRRSPCPARCRDEKYQDRMRAAIARIRRRVSGG